MQETPPWRQRLRRELTGWLVLKCIALGLLWLWFFSPAQRIAVDAAAASRHLALSPAVIGTPAELVSGARPDG